MPQSRLLGSVLRSTSHPMAFLSEMRLALSIRQQDCLGFSPNSLLSHKCGPSFCSIAIYSLYSEYSVVKIKLLKICGNDKALANLVVAKALVGTPRGIRIPDLLVRSQTLYPAELGAHND